jgi:hypothetical protein
MNVSYSYTQTALDAIKSEKEIAFTGKEVDQAVKIFMEHRLTVHLLYEQPKTFMSTTLGTFWPVEIISVYNNNHVWFCTREEWDKKLAEKPGWRFTEITDPMGELLPSYEPAPSDPSAPPPPPKPI